MGSVRAVKREVGEKFSEGAERTWRELARLKWSQTRFQTELGAPGGMVSRWLYGARRPSIEWCAAIETLFGINERTGKPRVPATSWARPASQQFVLQPTGTD